MLIALINVCFHKLNLAVGVSQMCIRDSPYTDKLVINLFNAGDAATFAEALVRLEKIGIGHELAYEIRLFTDENMLQSGEAFKDLLDPESVSYTHLDVYKRQIST